jgi:hypothetical protein
VLAKQSRFTRFSERSFLEASGFYSHGAGILPMVSVILLGSRNLSVIWQRLLDNQPASVKVQGSIDDPE